MSDMHREAFDMKDKLRELAERWSAKDPVCEAGVITITMNQCAAELLAILATPAQTVDIEAVREVIAQLKDFGFAETKDMDKWSDKLSQAIGDKT